MSTEEKTVYTRYALFDFVKQRGIRCNLVAIDITFPKIKYDLIERTMHYTNCSTLEQPISSRRQAAFGLSSVGSRHNTHV